MPREFLTDEQVETEIARLKASPMVRLAQKEQTVRYKRRKYLYNLRNYEKRGIALSERGITLESLETEFDFNTQN